MDPRKWPKSKLPALRDGETIIGDSDGIRHWLEQNGADLNPGLSDLDKATSRAFVRMAEEHMYFHLVLDRWGDDTVWPLVRDTYFAEIPSLIRPLIANRMRRGLVQGMKAQGLGRLSPSERMTRLEPDLEAIAHLLWQGPFLFGSQPTAADASVAAMLGAMAATPGDTALKKRIASDEILFGYVQRVAKALG